MAKRKAKRKSVRRASKKPAKRRISTLSPAAHYAVPKQTSRKRTLAAHEEFDILKLVIDKFLWLGTGLMGFGLFTVLSSDLQEGLWYILSGAIVMVIFAWFIIKEFERIR